VTFLNEITQYQIFGWVILPVLIFLARICDVSVGTLRIIYVSRGKKLLSPILGFIEVSIWLLAISQIMQNMNNIYCFLAYACGFAMGNFVGIQIEEKLAMGILVIRIFLTNAESEIKEKLNKAGFGVTSIDAHGMSGNVEIIFSVIKRKDLKAFVKIIESCQSGLFYSIEDAKSVNRGIFPTKNKLLDKHYVKQGK
jgi:uncharacterized protein YebE (UPF0316 family)